MALRRLAIALALLSPGRALAERRLVPLSWANATSTRCPSRLTVQPGSAEFQGYWATSFGGGLDTYRALGITQRLHAGDGWFAVLDAHAFTTERRVTVPVDVRDTKRLGGVTLGAGGTPLRGKVRIADDTIVLFDVVASISLGVAMVEQPDHRLDHWFAAAGELTLRARLTREVSLDLGVHDTYVGAQHELEARLGIGVWIPD